LYINEGISAKAMFYVEQHYLCHSTHLADALIGATAVVNGLTILTGNDNHYKTIKEIEIKKFRPSGEMRLNSSSVRISTYENFLMLKNCSRCCLQTSRSKSVIYQKKYSYFIFSVQVLLEKGDILSIRTPGAGGYGDAGK